MQFCKKLLSCILVPFLPSSSAICSVSGNSFIKSFDDRYYHFPGECTYQVAADCVDDTYAIHSYLDPLCELSDGLCKRTVRLYLGDIDINLQQNSIVTVNNVTVHLPYVLKNLVIKTIAAYVTVEGWNGLTIHWDGHSSLYIKLPPLYANKTCGLCGNFNGNPEDDFTSSSGDIKSSAKGFGDTWKRLKVGEECISNVESVSKAVSGQNHLYKSDNNIRNINDPCNILLSSSFLPCHKIVSPIPYIKRCNFDVAHCNSSQNVSCTCDSLTQYSRECASKNVVLVWRNDKLCRKLIFS